MNKIGFSFIIAACCLPLQGQTVADTTLTLQEVEVKGRHIATLSSGPINQLRVENSLSSVGNTTAEALRQLPSLTTDIEGNLTYRGSNSPGMLIDGIPYGLLEEYSGDVLIQLPALFFSTLSLASYPSITLVPDGDAGALNLSSEQVSQGFSPLTLTLGAGWHERANAGALLNLRPQRFRITAAYNYRREYRDRTFRKTVTTPANRTEMNNNAAARPTVHLANLKVDYDLTPADRLTLQGLYHLMAYDRYGRINNQVFNPQGKPLKQVIRNRYNDQRQEAVGAEVAWNHTFANAAQLQARFNYNNFAYTEGNDFRNENPETGAIVAEDNLYIHRRKHNYYWTVGYQHPFAGNGLLRLGYIGRAKEEQHQTDANNLVGGVWTPAPTKSDSYRFSRHLNLLYLSLEKRWGSLFAEAGVQAELNTQTMREQPRDPAAKASHDLTTQTNRLHLYPRARLSYDLNRGNELAISYQQRVIRPTAGALSSFTDLSDATHVVRGNPHLRDEFVHTLELNYRLSLPRFQLTPALYYRNRVNRIVEIAAQEGDETVWMKENMGGSQALGIDLSATWKPFRFLSVGLSANLYRDEIDGRMAGYDTDKKSLLCWDTRGNLLATLTPTTEVQVDGLYLSEQLTPQGTIGSRYTVNAGISQYLFARRLCVNLSVNNLFDSLEEVTLIDTEKMQLEQHRNRDARVAWLTLSYRW